MTLETMIPIGLAVAALLLVLLSTRFKVGG
jgi:hypothetical protein